MPKLDTYRKQAKQLLRWHREGNYSVGEKVRLVARYRDLTDVAVLAMQMPLALAQEIVALEQGFPNWSALKAAASAVGSTPSEASDPADLELKPAVPVLFVKDVVATATYYRDRLGFEIDFLHGNPAFYAAVRRDRASFHLRLVCSPNFAELAGRETSLILATVEISNVKALFDDLKARGADFTQNLARQAWGGTTFHIRDPDGNVISFVQYQVPTDD